MAAPALRIHAVLNGFKAQQRLRKDLLRREAAQNLVDVPDLDLAGGRGLRGSAMLNLPALSLGRAHVLAVGSNFVAQTVVQQRLAQLGKILPGGLRLQADLVGNPGRVHEGRRLHQFQILLILRGGAAGYLVHPLARMPLVQPAKAVEGGEKLVVPAESGGGHKAAHGEGVDQAVVEILVGRDLCRRNQLYPSQGGLAKLSAAGSTHSPSWPASRIKVSA